MKRLFVGGYWHGKVVEIPEDSRHWNVAVPPRNVFAALEDSLPGVSDMTVDRYELRTVEMDGVPLKVFMVRGITSGHAISNALIYAAGLSGPRSERQQ